MDFVKQQISSAVKNASSGNSDPTNTHSGKDNNSNNDDPKSTTTVAAAQGDGQVPDPAKTITQTLGSLGAGGKDSSTPSGVDGLHIPADLSKQQLGRFGSQLGAAARAEQAQHPNKSAEAIGADTLKQVQDLQRQGQGQQGAVAALQGGLHQAAEKEALKGAVEQGRHFLTQQQKKEGLATTDTASTTAPASAIKPPVTRSTAAELGGDSADFS
ncbi:hypothetical protein PG985_005989 [Apiospora marii]|uniref:Uncharacterized protein n=1 Tax=Apiospora marii TaxID=335849 RepID=A0ABR1S7N2_9PEZI